MERRTRSFNEKLGELKQAFFKKHILESYQELDEAKLSKDERFSLSHIQFNPRMLIILDDCAAELTNAIVNSPVFKKIFFQGRWCMISALITCHTPNDLATGLRKNTFNCLFTDADTAVSYFTNKSNGFSLAARKDAERMVSEVFTDGDPEHPFMKFAYVRDSVEKFYVYEVEYPRTFQFGSAALWEAEEEAAAEDEAINPESEFYSAYGLGETAGAPPEEKARTKEPRRREKRR